MNFLRHISKFDNLLMCCNGALDSAVQIVYPLYYFFVN